jgi:hypothetical protein
MASTLAHGLNYIATQQIKQIISDLKSDRDDDYLYNSVSYPLIYVDTVQNSKNTSPYVMVSPVGNVGTQVTYGKYTDLDKDKSVLKTITKYFLFKILDKWLYREFRPLLGFVKITDGTPSLIRNMSDYKPDSVNSDSVENVEKRIDYLEKVLINRKLVAHVLKKIVNENNIRWTQLNKHKSLIKKILKKYLHSKLQEAIEKSSR